LRWKGRGRGGKDAGVRKSLNEGRGSIGNRKNFVQPFGKRTEKGDLMARNEEAGAVRRKRTWKKEGNGPQTEGLSKAWEVGGIVEIVKAG